MEWSSKIFLGRLYSLRYYRSCTGMGLSTLVITVIRLSTKFRTACTYIKCIVQYTYIYFHITMVYGLSHNGPCRRNSFRSFHFINFSNAFAWQSVVKHQPEPLSNVHDWKPSFKSSADTGTKFLVINCLNA